MKWRFCVAKSTEIIHFSFFIIHHSLFILFFCPSPSPIGATRACRPLCQLRWRLPILWGATPTGRGFSLDLRQRQPHPSTFGCHLLPLEKANLCVTFYNGVIKIYNFALFKTVVGRLTSASLLLWEKVSAIADGWVESQTNSNKIIVESTK